jgi:hypothetical protein
LLERGRLNMAFVQRERYGDEAYAMIDAIDTLKKKRALDSRALATFLGAGRLEEPGR